MTIEEIKLRLEKMVQNEIDHLRERGRTGNLHAIAQNRVGDIFWSMGLRWNRQKAKEI